MQGLWDEINLAEADLIEQEEKVKDFNLRLGGNLEKQAVTVATLNRLILQLQSNADLLATLQEQNPQIALSIAVIRIKSDCFTKFANRFVWLA